MIPAVASGIPVRVRNSFRPQAPGTLVDGRFTRGPHPVKAVSAIRGLAMITVQGQGMAGVPGVAARLFGALAAESISVTMISQASSESSITLAIPSHLALAAERALKQAFRDDLSSGEVDEILVRTDVGLLAAVGLGMAHHPGIAARVCGALGGAQINILGIAQGSSELNMTLVVDDSDLDAAVRAVHLEFHLDEDGRDGGTGGADGAPEEVS
jgi:aspartate kinase